MRPSIQGTVKAKVESVMVCGVFCWSSQRPQLKLVSPLTNVTGTYLVAGYFQFFILTLLSTSDGLLQ